ncbi:MAG: hypothetical protein M3313_12960 [Actinomycetota bacterium]|nr:hypothetical protein [Actinomycetota bacterium]
MSATTFGRFVLLHSPLVGPRTVLPLAKALEGLGHEAAVPDLSSAVSESGLSTTILKRAVTQALGDPRQGPLILAGHSGAGVYLPILATEIEPAGQVLIDAVVPPVAGAFLPSADFRQELDRLVESDRRLPPWPRWWDDNVMAALVPNPGLRAAISGECPRLPIGFYDSVIQAPPEWTRPWVGYLRLSDRYEREALIASGRGWPVTRRDGGHLDLATRPDEVVLDLIALVQPVLESWTGPVQ